MNANTPLDPKQLRTIAELLRKRKQAPRGLPQTIASNGIALHPKMRQKVLDSKNEDSDDSQVDMGLA